VSVEPVHDRFTDEHDGAEPARFAGADGGVTSGHVGVVADFAADFADSLVTLSIADTWYEYVVALATVRSDVERPATSVV
jgi:hypothetical protein